jgi:hypothetical protein
MFSKQPGGVMTEGQADAFDLATRELNSKGYAWLDNHSSNYTFKKLPGEDKWSVVVLDAGGIVPMEGKSAELARALQARINTPEEGFQAFVTRFENAATKVRNGIAHDEYLSILKDHGKNINYKEIELDSVYEISFNPSGVVKYKKAQQRFRMTLEEAEIYYGKQNKN